MVSFISEEMVVSFLSKFNIDYYLLSLDVQAITILLSQIAMILFYIALLYIGYKILNRIF